VAPWSGSLVGMRAAGQRIARGLRFCRSRREDQRHRHSLSGDGGWLVRIRCLREAHDKAYLIQKIVGVAIDAFKMSGLAVIGGAAFAPTVETRQISGALERRHVGGFSGEPALQSDSAMGRESRLSRECALSKPLTETLNVTDGGYGSCDILPGGRVFGERGKTTMSLGLGLATGLQGPLITV